MPSKILIVEDTPDLLDSLIDILVMEGFDVKGTSNGLEALEAMKKEKYDLIISDLRMPLMDGFELIKTVRANERWAFVPILIFSARPEDGSKQRAIGLGANDFLPKPSPSERIIEAIQRLLI